MLRLLEVPCQDLTRIANLLVTCPELTSIVSWKENRWMDSGLLAAYRNLITEDTPSSPPPANHIKVLADKAPSTREHLGPIKARRKLPQILNALMLLLTIGRGSGRGFLEH